MKANRILSLLMLVAVTSCGGALGLEQQQMKHHKHKHGSDFQIQEQLISTDEQLSTLSEVKLVTSLRTTLD